MTVNELIQLIPKGGKVEIEVAKDLVSFEYTGADGVERGCLFEHNFIEIASSDETDLKIDPFIKEMLNP